jgi:hypothetical protein
MPDFGDYLISVWMKRHTLRQVAIRVPHHIITEEEMQYYMEKDINNRISTLLPLHMRSQDAKVCKVEKLDAIIDWKLKAEQIASEYIDEDTYVCSKFKFRRFNNVGGYQVFDSTGDLKSFNDVCHYIKSLENYIDDRNSAVKQG